MQISKKMFNSILLILLLVSDSLIAIETSNKLNAKILKNLSENKNLNKNGQFTTIKKSVMENLPTKSPNKLNLNFEKFDTKGTFLNNDPNASSASTAKTYTECKKQFFPIISLLPDSIQKSILFQFANNKSTDSTSCCDSAHMIQSIGNEFDIFGKEFAEILTKRQRQNKKGFACFRANEIVANEEGLPLDHSLIKQNKDFIKKMLKSQNDLSMNLLACMNQIKKISLRNIGLLCVNKETKDKIFNKNTSNEYTSIKLFPEDEVETFNHCFEYTKKIDSFSNTILGAYLDSLNSLIGTDKCNYLSNLFSMDPIIDKDDPLLPKDLKDLAEKVDKNDPSKLSNSPKTLMDKWQSCAKTKSEFDQQNITELAQEIGMANYLNPNGLSTYVGRADINYGIIKEKFNLVDYPYYQLKCEINGCKAGFKGKNYSEMPELKDIIKGQKTSLKISCCDNICVIYVKIKDNTSFDGDISLKAAEIFEMKGDRNSIDISNLELNELKNAKSCLEAPVYVIPDISKNNQTISNNTENDKPKTKEFLNKELIDTMKEILAKPDDFDNDFRLKTNTLLRINYKGKSVSLNDYVYESLFKQNTTGFIKCENGECLIQDQKDEDVKTPILVYEKSALKISALPALRKKSSSSGSSFKPKSSSSSGSSFSPKSSSSSGNSFNKGGTSTIFSNNNSNFSQSKQKNSFFNNYNKTPNNLQINNNISKNSKYANSIKMSTVPKSFNSNYKSSLYNNNYNYSSMKYQGNFSNNNFSSYNKSFKSYDSHSKYLYKNNYKIKIKFDYDYKYYYEYRYGFRFNYYNSYVYNPIYADIFYPYNRYSSFNYYGYYNRPNYYDYAYMQSTQALYNNSGSHSVKYNHPKLPADYDPSDWVPSYKPHFNRDIYLENISNDLKSVKIFSQCCEIFCIIIIKNDNDKIVSNKKRVFFEVYLKNYAFFESNIIDASKKKCLVENIIENKDNPILATENIFKKCGIESPYQSLPLKKACIKNMNYHCENTGFNDLILGGTSYITRSDNKDAKKCEIPADCLILPSTIEVTEEQKKKCGGKLLNLFSQNFIKPHFSSFVSPCEKIEETKVSFMEIKINKSKIKSNQNSVYVDLRDPKLKENIDKLNNLANGVVQSSNISIDNNTASRSDTVSDSDLENVNKATDSLIKDAIVPQNQSNGEYTGENNFVRNSSLYINMNGAFYSLLIFLFAIFFN